MKSFIQSLLKPFGYRFSSLRDSIIDRDVDFDHIYETCKTLTLTTRERMFSLYEAVKYIVSAGIEGDFVECGVYKGGSVMVMAMTLKLIGADRKIWLYDTFEGMPPKEEKELPLGGQKNWDSPSYASIEEVTRNVLSTGYDNFLFVKGKVEDTIPSRLPDKIAILRLNTDWYESTKHELDFLYPLLSKGGVLIIDDYAAWAGAKKAVDEYFNGSILLNRIDHDSRLSIK